MSDTPSSHHAPWRISVDTGGTFTDCVARAPDGARFSTKILSSGCLRVRARPTNATEMSLEGFEHDPGTLVGMRMKASDGSEATITGLASNRRILLDAPILPSSSECVVDISTGEPSPVLASRLLTGTPPGARFPDIELRVATTRATNALLERSYPRTALFVTTGFADMLRIGTQQRPELFTLDIIKPEPITQLVYELDARLDSHANVVDTPADEHVRDAANRALDDGATVAAIALMHSWKDPSQEERVCAALLDAGFEIAITSASVAPRIGYLSRASTAALEAALTPVMGAYISDIRAAMPDTSVLVTTSTGGLVDAERFHPVDGLLSGPAGGVMGASHVASIEGHTAVIGLDMGGTSADIVRIEHRAEERASHTIDNIKIARPALAIETIAAGGGSICEIRDRRPTVGPSSAGADPGPACYGRGGPLTLTDVNLLLGRFDESRFTIPIERQPAQRALDAVHREYINATGEHIEQADLLESFLTLANTRMASAIQKISTHRGIDPSTHALVAFGGAAPQHACDVAQQLDIATVIVPSQASLLSAVGVESSRRTIEHERTLLIDMPDEDEILRAHLQELEHECTQSLHHQTSDTQHWTFERTLTLRYKGQDEEHEVSYTSPQDARERFIARYRDIYEHSPINRAIELVRIRARATETNRAQPEPQDSAQHAHTATHHPPGTIARDSLHPGDTISVPSLIVDTSTTTAVPRAWSARVSTTGALVLTHEHQVEQSTPRSHGHTSFDREILIHRMSVIAEEMGESLRRTAASVNVKERRDYSCGVLDNEGRLVASAPHMPVHLGALGFCVRRVAEALGPPAPGDVWITNHPAFGGSHLPDITLIKPVFDANETHLGYVASRAHHAEIGGTSPGSMPPDATSLDQEGVVIPAMRLADASAVHTDQLERMLREALHPSRAPSENIADVGAALASANLASARLARLGDESGAEPTSHAMRWIIDHTEDLVRSALTRLVPSGATALETLDDGTSIHVAITRHDDRWLVDFEGTSPQHPSNLNAPLCVTRSAVAYVLRLLLDRAVPLNDGLLAPLDIRVPEGCFLNPIFNDDPARCPAVAAGNVETSQRVTDTLLKALELCACSQGTMNNLLIGNDSFGYYETICGGSGATPIAPGADAVHTHMTNTAITDAEILEHRYPMRLERFTIRPHSGGAGTHRGGDGVVRAITLLEDAQVSINAQHRESGPYALGGASDGKPGEQRIRHQDASHTPLEGRCSVRVRAGDTIEIETPGGGGCSSTT
ncbi:MAG: hydantoinase B/oxoprolinase family protein [Phycisphaerales bacterium JB043]